MPSQHPNPFAHYDTISAAKMQSRRLAAIYYRAGAERLQPSYTRRADRVQICSDVIAVQSGRIVQQWHCEDRLCPICAIRAARQLAANARTVLQIARSRCDCRPYMLTLTQRNCTADELPTRIDDMQRAIAAIMHDMREHRRAVLGYARTIEITIGRAGDYHPHVHAILLMDPNAPKHLLRARYWGNAWARYMGTERYQQCDPICHMQPIRPNRRRGTSDIAAAAAEVAKYTAKSAGILRRADNYQRILDIDAAISGRKLRSYGGIWRAIRAELRLSDAPSDPPNAVLADVPLEVWRWSGADCQYQRIR